MKTKLMLKAVDSHLPGLVEPKVAASRVNALNV